MKKIIFTLFSLLVLQLAYSQTTYYWVGGTSPTSFTSNSNWNTSLDGTGTPRAAQANSDVLIFDGTNVGGSTPATGPVVAPVTSTAMGRLILQNGADLALTRSASGTATITIGDDPNGNDFVVFPGCKFRLRGTIGSVLVTLASNAGGSNIPAATTSATAMIYGDVFLEEATPTTSTVAQNRFTSRFKGAFVFTNGSSLTTLPAYGYYPFGTTGSSTTPAAAGVVFETGSSFYYGGGASPFGSNSTSYLVDFQTGSKFYFRAPNTTNMFNGRAYGDMIVDNNTTVTADGSLYKVDSLRIESGSTFITHTTGSTPVNGHILNNGTFTVPAADPNRSNKLVMTGPNGQTISGTGTFNLGNFIISNLANVNLQRTVTVDSSTIIYGSLNPNGKLAGPGTVTTKTAQTTNVTGNTNVDSFLVKNVSSLVGVEIGMSVTGTNIQPNTVITNISSANSTISLSKPVTGTVTYATAATSLTIFNGNGAILPIKFGDVTATLLNGQVRVKWQVLTESNVNRYEVERSLNASQFANVATIKANGASEYTAVDLQPSSGTNFYRVKSVSNDGDIKYSIILKINNAKGKAEFLVYPNPVKDRRLNIQLNNVEKGTYNIDLYNTAGQKIFTKVIEHPGGSVNQTITLPASVMGGIYRMSATSSNLSLQQSLIVE